MDLSDKKIIAEYAKFAEDYLGIPYNYKLYLTFDRQDPALKTHAYYNTDNKVIKVYAKNRCIADVLRSIGHELVHHRQNIQNNIPDNSQDIGGYVEDEANAIAGQMVKKFGYMHPEMAIYDKNLIPDL